MYWTYQMRIEPDSKPFVKLFGHNLLNTDRLCSGQTVHQTVWLLGGAEVIVPGSARRIVCQTVRSQTAQHGQALHRSKDAPNSLVTGWS